LNEIQSSDVRCLGRVRHCTHILYLQFLYSLTERTPALSRPSILTIVDHLRIWPCSLTRSSGSYNISIEETSRSALSIKLQGHTHTPHIDRRENVLRLNPFNSYKLKSYFETSCIFLWSTFRNWINKRNVSRLVICIVYIYDNMTAVSWKE